MVFVRKAIGDKHQDDMGKILDAIREADTIILASPMNAGQVTAVTKRFIEAYASALLLALGKNGAESSRQDPQQNGLSSSPPPPCLH